MCAGAPRSGHRNHIGATFTDTIIANAIVHLANNVMRETGMLPVLIEAIKGRRVVTLWYDPGVRVVEPHALGYGSDGQLLLRAFQVAGVSASGQPSHWKLFRLDRMRDAALNGKSFRKPRPDYKRDDSAMTQGIIAQV